MKNAREETTPDESLPYPRERESVSNVKSLGMHKMCVVRFTLFKYLDYKLALTRSLASICGSCNKIFDRNHDNLLDVITCKKSLA